MLCDRNNTLVTGSGDYLPPESAWGDSRKLFGFGKGHSRLSYSLQQIDFMLKLDASVLLCHCRNAASKTTGEGSRRGALYSTHWTGSLGFTQTRKTMIVVSNRATHGKEFHPIQHNGPLPLREHPRSLLIKPAASSHELISLESLLQTH